MRTKREKQYLQASYYHQPVQEFVLPLQCWWCWKPPTLTTPLEDLVFNSNLTIPNPENRRAYSMCFTTIYKQGLFPTTRSTAGRVHWPERTYLHVSTVVDVTEEWLKEFWQFKVGGLIIYRHNSHPSSSTSTFCSYLQSGTNQYGHHFFWFTQFPFIFLIAGQEFSFSPSPRKICFNLLQPMPYTEILFLSSFSL